MFERILLIIIISAVAFKLFIDTIRYINKIKEYLLTSNPHMTIKQQKQIEITYVVFKYCIYISILCIILISAQAITETLIKPMI